MILIENARLELLAKFYNYFNRDSAFLNECAKVTSFLSDHTQMLAQLRVLRDEFEGNLGVGCDDADSYYRALGDYFKDQFNYETAQKYAPVKTEPTPPKKTTSYKNAFSKTLGKAEQFALFSIAEDYKVPIYLRYLEPAIFRKQIALKMHWKDLGVGGDHGEFTHRIQWYCIIKANILSNPAALFSKIASVVYEKNDMIGLWDFICDNEVGNNSAVPFRSSMTDFRSPERLHIYITKSKYEELRPLSSFLAARAIKRQYFKDAIGTSGYVAKVMFGRQYIELDEVQRTAVDDALELGIVFP